MNEILKKRIEEEAERNWMMSGAFEAGARFALSHQWISVDEALPERNEKVLCMMKSNHAIVSGYIFEENGIAKVATNPDFEFEDYMDYEVMAWMPMPKFETKDKEDEQ